MIESMEGHCIVYVVISFIDVGVFALHNTVSVVYLFTAIGSSSAAEESRSCRSAGVSVVEHLMAIEFT